MHRPRGSYRTLLVALLVGACATPVAVAVAAGGQAPANTAAPTISGAAAQGATLTVAAGTWSGAAPITYAYQWERCNSGVTSCSDIAGATGQTYVAVAADAGSRLRVRVTATNAAGQGTAQSGATDAIKSTSGNGPVNTALPVVTGTPAPGNSLTTSAGTWSGSPAPTYTYHWQQCDSSGQNCQDVDGVEGTTYPVIAADLGYEIRSVVTATNSSGTDFAYSQPTAVVSTTATAGGGTTGGAGAPFESAGPTLSGFAAVGATVTADPGAWTGTAPIAYAYQWQRCDASGLACTSIVGATAKTYVLRITDVGATVRVQVTASNSGGSANDVSPTTGVVSATGAATGGGTTTTPPVAPTVTGPPAVVAVPQVTGLLLVGARLTTSEGEWTSAPGLTFQHAWFRCSAKGLACVAVTGATALTYLLTPADAHHVFKTSITAVNTFGSTVATSKTTDVVSAARAIRLRGGRYSIPVAAVAGTPRLTVKLTRGRRLIVRVTVSDTAGDAVRGAPVAVALAGRRASARTGTNGSATMRFAPPVRAAVLTARTQLGAEGAPVVRRVRVSPGG